jgi:hypothetical protein
LNALRRVDPPFAEFELGDKRMRSQISASSGFAFSRHRVPPPTWVQPSPEQAKLAKKARCSRSSRPIPSLLLIHWHSEA